MSPQCKAARRIGCVAFGGYIIGLLIGVLPWWGMIFALLFGVAVVVSQPHLYSWVTAPEREDDPLA